MRACPVSGCEATIAMLAASRDADGWVQHGDDQRDRFVFSYADAIGDIHLDERLVEWYGGLDIHFNGGHGMKDGKLYGRYTITHKDGEPIDPEKRYFVLAPDTDSAARAALIAYADAVEPTHPILAGSIRQEYGIAPADEGRVERCARHLLAVMAEFPDDTSCCAVHADALERALDRWQPVRYDQEW